MTNTTGYSAISVINHWVTVLLVTAMLGLMAAGAPDSAGTLRRLS